jgi:glyoxylase-like metal-dependent hydrolase (beta-lactamase superfamily II)
MLSVFLGEFDDCSVLLDCGSSLDTNKALRYFKKHEIPLSSFKYLITSHHHFDHCGGIWKLYDTLKNFNPDIKILTNAKTKELLNDFNHHLTRGKRTYGNLVGTMKPIEDIAFQIIKPSTNFDSDSSKIEIFDRFYSNGSEVKLGIIESPGHTPDHQCPLFVKDGEIDFIHFGESAGTIYHETKLLSMPTSMPIYYNHEDYMKTISNFKKIYPLKAGFGHFGVINGNENVRKLLIEHESFMIKFKEEILKYYKETPETKYIVQKIMPLLTPRTDLAYDGDSIFNGVALAIVYGMMLSCGLRKLPDEELKYVKKYNSN